MKKNEFGYAFVDSPSLACKIWALEIFGKFLEMIGRSYY